MRARIKFTTDLVEDGLRVVFIENHWWPHFDQASGEAEGIVKSVEASLDQTDLELYQRSKKLVLTHTATDSRGTISHENGVWVTRLLNQDIHLLQIACQTLISHLSDYAKRNGKYIKSVAPIQIVELGRKDTIIQGEILATREDRLKYAKNHKLMEVRIYRIGGIVLIALLALTFPYPGRAMLPAWVMWLISIFEKLIGSVAVTSLISWAQYRSFVSALREDTVRWSIPGQPAQQDIRHAT